MTEIKSLTVEQIPSIIELISDKCMRADSIYACLFDNISIESFLKSKLRNFFTNNIGYGVFQDNKLVSFLLGYSNITQLKGNESGSYIPFWGHYIANKEEKHFLHLYQKLTQDWADNSVFNHIITYLPNNQNLQEQLYNLGFGLLVIDAIRAMALITLKPIKSEFHLRSITSDDQSEINELESNFCSYLRSSPTFLYSTEEESKSQMNEFISDIAQTFVIEYQGKIIAAIRGILGSSNLQILSHPKLISINFAFTDPKYRGEGLGTHLLKEILKWGLSKNAIRCTVDFESANILANRFWLRYFTPIAFSAIRKIDNRL